MPGDAIEAAARAVLRQQFWAEVSIDVILSDARWRDKRALVVAETTAAIRAYLAAQPAERTAAEMRKEIGG